MLVGIEPGTSRSRVRCFTTAPQCSTNKSSYYHRTRATIVLLYWILTTKTWNALTEVRSEGTITGKGNITGKHCRILACMLNAFTEVTSDSNITCDGNITGLHSRILPCTWNALTKVMWEGNITWKHCRILPLGKWCQREILLVRVILQGNIAEYHPARDMVRPMRFLI